MSIWFFLWLFLSGALLYFLGWTIFILLRQKQTWKQFAAKKKLRYRTQSMMASPEMNGVIDGYAFNYFVAEHMGMDARSSRKLSAVEVQLSSKLPFEVGIASGGMVQIVNALRLKEEIRPTHDKWDKNYIAATSSRAALESYLTPERLESLTTLMKIKNAWVIFLARGDLLLLRFDTPDALDTADKLNRITQKMSEVAKIFEMKAGEEGRLKTEMLKKPVKEVSLTVDEEHFKEAGGIQLEDDKSNS